MKVGWVNIVQFSFLKPHHFFLPFFLLPTPRMTLSTGQTQECLESPRGPGDQRFRSIRPERSPWSCQNQWFFQTEVFSCNFSSAPYSEGSALTTEWKDPICSTTTKFKTTFPAHMYFHDSPRWHVSHPLFCLRLWVNHTAVVLHYFAIPASPAAIFLLYETLSISLSTVCTIVSMQ